MRTAEKNTGLILTPRQKYYLGFAPLIFLGVAAIIFAAVLVTSAWLADDAFISFRVAWHAANGYGLRWDVADRVQAFTNPLWTMLIALAQKIGIENVARVATTLSLGLSALAAGTAVWIARRRSVSAAAAVLVILFLSKAFVDFSTSGLENPLTHLLLAVFLLIYLDLDRGKERVLALSALTGLVALNRLDSLLLVLPALLLEFWQDHRPQTLKLFALGLLPFFAWELFALIYYGWPLPNTFYAKLGGLEPLQALPYGLAYFKNSLAWDPITLIGILSGISLAFFSRERAFLSIACGILLSLVYTALIGGDFMTGRFLAAPFFVSVILISRVPASLSRIAVLAVLLALAGLVLPTRSPLFSPTPTAHRTLAYVVSGSGIADEAVFYCYGTCLLNQATYLPNHPWVVDSQNIARNDRVVVKGGIGMAGYYAGPSAKIVDPYALTDPFLARMPGTWHRPGHIVRDPGEDYLASFASGENKILDPQARALLDDTRRITRAPIFSGERWATILRANFQGLGKEGIPFASAALILIVLIYWLGIVTLGIGGLAKHIRPLK